MSLPFIPARLLGERVAALLLVAILGGLSSLVFPGVAQAQTPPAGERAEVPPWLLQLQKTGQPSGLLSVHHTFKPNPAVQAQIDAMDAASLASGASFAAGDVTVHGEIVVMEGDDTFVTSFGNNQYGLRYDNERQDPMALTQKFYDHFDDDFDFIVVWTSFRDYGAEGLAYYVGVRNLTQGIGQQQYNSGQFWGSGKQLQGFLNMKAIALYGNIANPNNMAYPVMGQEITHRWLAFLEFKRANGQNSTDMLGRDDSHWSALLHSYASVQDGLWWNDNGNGDLHQAGRDVGLQSAGHVRHGPCSPRPRWSLGSLSRTRSTTAKMCLRCRRTFPTG